MQIKTTTRYYLTHVRMAIINKSTNNKCWGGCGEREPSGNEDGCSPCGKQYGLPQKIKNGSALWPNDFTSGNTAEKPNTLIWKNTHTPMFTAAFIYSSQDTEASEVSVNRQMDKEDVAHMRVCITHIL